MARARTAKKTDAGADAPAAAAEKPARARRKPAARAAPSSPRTRRATRAPTAALPELAAVLQRLSELAATLEVALGEVPRAAEFEPLAEHLYEFARTAPALADAVAQVPRAAEPVASAVKSLQEISETLQFTQESFAESILGLPTAEEYQPLVEPLSEFARVAPDLTTTLRDVLGATAPLARTIDVMSGVVGRLERSMPALDEGVRGLRETGAAFDGRLRRLGEVVEALETRLRAPAVRAVPSGLAADVAVARDALRDALAGLPRDDDYARVAAQLRELATVSPSLMEWLQQVGSVQAPLEASVGRLQVAAERLDLVLASIGENDFDATPSAEQAKRALTTLRTALVQRSSSPVFDPADEALWDQVRDLCAEADELRSLIPGRARG